MDYRFALLLHTQLGLGLPPEDAERVLTGDPHAPDLAREIRDPVARAYLHSHREWLATAERIWRRSQGRGIRWSYPGQPDYPRGWEDLENRPLIFSYLGQPVWLTLPLIAIVGSRTPLDDTTRWMQRELASFLRRQEVGVVSGGARGVDQTAHRLALANGRPTIVVYPSGLLEPYPLDREELWESVLLADGCLLSTFALEEGMRKSNFFVRNRWIAALADSVLVAEANRRSGSAMTARFAGEIGRELATLPVSANAAQGLGNLALIRDGGAQMMITASDLDMFFSRNRGRFSGPTLAQRIQREEEKDGVDDPQRDSGGHVPTAGDAFGRHVQHPVGDEDDEAHDETTAAGGALVGDGAETHAQ